MGERLGDGEAALDRRESLPEEVVRDVVARPRLGPERGLGAVEAVGVMRSDRLAARGRVGDRLAVPAVRDPRREPGDEPQRVEVVAERIRAALRIEPDRRRDRRQQRVARDQDVAAVEHEMAVGVAGRRVDAPAVDLVARLDERRVPGEADEVREHVPGLDQLVGDLGRHAVEQEPLRDPLGPVVRAPDALALRVVEAALRDRRARSPPRPPPRRRRGPGACA